MRSRMLVLAVAGLFGALLFTSDAQAGCRRRNRCASNTYSACGGGYGYGGYGYGGSGACPTGACGGYAMNAGGYQPSSYANTGGYYQPATYAATNAGCNTCAGPAPTAGYANNRTVYANPASPTGYSYSSAYTPATTPMPNQNLAPGTPNQNLRSANVGEVPPPPPAPRQEALPIERAPVPRPE